MDFSLETYKNIVSLLHEYHYEIAGYKNYKQFKRPAILRHDIDFSIEDSYNFSLFEDSLGVKSTYFVLLATGFYNPMLRENRLMLKDMSKRGFTIGLHYDTTAYDGDMAAAIKKEKIILENILDEPVDLLSFHRPAPAVLENNLTFEGMINAYSNTFFKEFKYCSDSRFFWRDNPIDTIKSNKYDKLHILTHAFAWHNTDLPPGYTYRKLIDKASWERYTYLTKNIRNPEEFISQNEAIIRWGVKGDLKNAYNL